MSAVSICSGGLDSGGEVPAALGSVPVFLLLVMVWGSDPEMARLRRMTKASSSRWSGPAVETVQQLSNNRRGSSAVHRSTSTSTTTLSSNSSGATVAEQWRSSGKAVAQQQQQQQKWRTSNPDSNESGSTAAVQTPVLGSRVRCEIEKGRRATMKGLRDLGFEICRGAPKGKVEDDLSECVCERVRG
ncbi:hypothetical protein SLEP1_g26180 [Rubroshorea leprosula]|uniref:Uncharacterized protein n=1 Tax=Rubroshorea leprosula TaxID=152421 RepID=A0AAV5JP61_9ROSI|nr:hypothetical protein SLEP1_g26180 [Rubroshorea leprosula]